MGFLTWMPVSGVIVECDEGGGVVLGGRPGVHAYLANSGGVMWKGPEEGWFYLGEIRSVYVLCRIRNYNMGFFNMDASYNYSGNIVWKGRSKGAVPRGRARAHTFFWNGY